MLDREKIEKGLQCCTAPTSDCDNCPYKGNDILNCFDNVKRDALDLITEQSTEIEQLRVRHASLDKQIRKKARRQFAEKLKSYYNKNFNSLKDSINCAGVTYHIDQILADMERKEEQ